MIDLKDFHISRIYNSNIEQKFYIYFRNHDTHEYKFSIRIGLTIDDIVYIEVEKLKYFDTLCRLISYTLDLLDIKKDIHKIRYKFSKVNSMSLDMESKMMRVYNMGRIVADIYLDDEYVNLYKFDGIKSEKTDIMCFLSNNNLRIIKNSSSYDADSILDNSKHEILESINYFNFLTKR